MAISYRKTNNEELHKNLLGKIKFANIIGK